jgi:hypothetical protein
VYLLVNYQLVRTKALTVKTGYATSARKMVIHDALWSRSQQESFSTPSSWKKKSFFSGRGLSFEVIEFTSSVM